MKLNVSLYVNQTWRKSFYGDLNAPTQYLILRSGHFERIVRSSNTGSSNGISTTAMIQSEISASMTSYAKGVGSTVATPLPQPNSKKIHIDQQAYLQ